MPIVGIFRDFEMWVNPESFPIKSCDSFITDDASLIEHIPLKLNIFEQSISVIDESIFDCFFVPNNKMITSRLLTILRISSL
jgi:hypothetical protein